MEEGKKRVHKFRSTLVIEINDTDSESENYNDYSSLIGERELPFPFSFDEENKKDVPSTQNTGSPENATATPRELVMIGVYKPESKSLLLHASSTPLKRSESSMNSSHVGILDLPNISKNYPKTPGSVSDADSERTVIYQESTPPKKKINIIDNRIIPVKSNKVVSQKGSDNKGTPSPIKKKVGEEESVSKRQKANHPYKEEKSHVSKRLFDHEKKSGGLPNSTVNEQNLNSSKSYTDVSQPRCSKMPEEKNVNASPKHKMKNHDEKAPKKKKVQHFDDEQRKQHLSKEEEGRKKGTDEKSKSKENESVQSTKENIADIPIITTENGGDRNIQLEQSVKSAPNKGEGKKLPKSAGVRQTLHANSSQPSCSTSIQNDNINERANMVAEKEANKDESVESNKNIQSVSKDKESPKIVNESQTLGQRNSYASCSSSGKAKDTETAAKTEGKKIETYVNLTQELVNKVYDTDNLLDDDKKALDIFRDMNTNYQYVCIKLFMQQRRWCNIFKFCHKNNLNFGDVYIVRMYNFFKEKEIVDTNFKEDDARVLLDVLDPNDLRSIRDNFKLKKTLIKKQDIIDALLKECSKQSRYPGCEPTLNILIKEIEQKLGRGIRLKESFHDAFYRTYILATFTNPRISNIKEYFKNIALPQYPIEENYTIFYHRDEFIRYAKARKYKDELKEVLGKNHVVSLQICKLIFEELQKTKNDENEARYEDTPHLIQFTARAVYVSALSDGMSTLATRFPKYVKDWLDYMIKEVNFPHSIGEWYYHLSWLYMKYLDPIDCTRAAELIIEVFLKKSEHLSEVQRYQLGKLGKKLKETIKYKISQLSHDRIAELAPETINIRGFPSTTVDARSYKSEKNEGDKTVAKSLEYIARMHYIEIGYTDGGHPRKDKEGSIIEAIFTLFFWDIIYSAKDIVPGTFISKIQSMPLDMNSTYFYLKRKNAIDKRLEEIEKTWSDSDLLKFVKDNYLKYSHLEAFCLVDNFIVDVNMLETLIDCIGRVVLAKIYKRFVENIREYKSGLPNLLIWNDHNEKSKFVQVKGEKELTMEQILWLNYLHSIGADVEICKVHSLISKRKTKEDTVSTEPSTSSSFVVFKDKKKKKVAAKPLMKTSTSSSSSGSKCKKSIQKLKEKTSEKSTAASSSSDESE